MKIAFLILALLLIAGSVHADEIQVQWSKLRPIVTGSVQDFSASANVYPPVAQIGTSKISAASIAIDSSIAPQISQGGMQGSVAMYTNFQRNFASGSLPMIRIYAPLRSIPYGPVSGSAVLFYRLVSLDRDFDP